MDYVGYWLVATVVLGIQTSTKQPYFEFDDGVLGRSLSKHVFIPQIVYRSQTP